METGYPDAPPVRVGTSLADLCGGVYLFSGIVSALYGREKSQRGAHVDIAMFDATLSLRYARHWSLRNWLMSPDLAAICYAYKTRLFLNNILSGR